jgi:hypothetical protein
MRDLRTLREGWDEVEREEYRLANDLTIEESVRIYLSLCNALGPLLKETEDLFRREREDYLIELQMRLRRLEDWLHQEHEITGGPV